MALRGAAAACVLLSLIDVCVLLRFCACFRLFLSLSVFVVVAVVVAAVVVAAVYVFVIAIFNALYSVDVFSVP